LKKNIVFVINRQNRHIVLVSYHYICKYTRPK